MSHRGHVAVGYEASRLAEKLSLSSLRPELETLTAGARQKGNPQPATADARAAAFAIETVIEETLAPLVGHKVGFSTRSQEQALRLAIAAALGFPSATAIRKRAAAPLQPVLICRGNPLAGPETFDYLGPAGCGAVFRGQWRRSRHGRGGGLVALGPRCEDCGSQITEDRRQLQARRRILS